MAATVKGTAHLYGVSGTVSNATVLSFRRKKTTANNAETTDENGNIIERRYDDQTVEATITIRPRSGYTEPEVGGTIAYAGVTYEITDVEESQQAKSHREFVLNIKKSEGISYT